MAHPCITTHKEDPPTATVHVLQATPVGPFTFRWPDRSVEQFSHGWDVLVEYGGAHYHIRHGIGSRHAYGRQRVHTVTWLGGSPTVEGVEADDYPQSRSLLSIIKLADRTQARSRSDVPPEYRSFKIVNHRREIHAPYSRDSLAVKISEDDLASWGLHAILRANQRSRSRFLSTPPVQVAPTALSVRAHPPEHKDAVAKALLEYAATLTGAPVFTPDPRANTLILADSFAFLLAVICDQGLKAERVWRLPYDLRDRLGHLDPARIADDPDSVARAVQAPPPLHRFVNTIPKWIVAAAQRVMHHYRGDASRIWTDRPTAAELQRRFDDFLGVDQKKAAMAVEILSRDLHVDVRDLAGSDIAYDVHVRRIFLRSGLAERDDRDHMVAVARQLHPERPGALDLPAWMIGRQWCDPASPKCSSCPITSVCAKDLASAAQVRGA